MGGSSALYSQITERTALLGAAAAPRKGAVWLACTRRILNAVCSLHSCARWPQVLRELHRSCQTEDGRDDLKKGTQVGRVQGGREEGGLQGPLLASRGSQVGFANFLASPQHCLACASRCCRCCSPPPPALRSILQDHNSTRPLLRPPAPQLLEIYALEIQMHTEQKNNKKLKELYQVGRGRGGAPSLLVLQSAVGFTKAARSWSGLLLRQALETSPLFQSSPPPESAGHQVGHPAPAHHGRHPRVRRQDAHARARVGGRRHRLLRGLQVVRRGGRGTRMWRGCRV